MTDRRKHIINLLVLGGSVLIVMTAVILFASFGFLDKNHLSGVEITVLEVESGQSLLDSGALRYPLEKLYPDDIEEMWIDSISLSAIEERYLANPFVRECRIFIDKHKTFQIELVERVPLLRIRNRTGGDFYIDREGVSMPVSHHFTPRTILATGYIPVLPLNESVDSSQVHLDLVHIAHAIESDDFMSSFISEIHVDSKGDILLYPLIGDFNIRLISPDNLDVKFENLKIFLREGLSRLGWDKYDELVIDYKNQIIGQKIINP